MVIRMLPRLGNDTQSLSSEFAWAEGNEHTLVTVPETAASNVAIEHSTRASVPPSNGSTPTDSTCTTNCWSSTTCRRSTSVHSDRYMSTS